MKLEHRGTHARLVLELAQGDKTQRQLAAEYGVDQSSISVFLGRHHDEVKVRAERLADEWAGLWIADKRNRVIEAQADVEAINQALGNTTDATLLRAKLAIMRQVAEELGQLTEKIELGGRLTYVVEGVDMSALQ
jgi:predicted metalloprotease